MTTLKAAAPQSGIVRLVSAMGISNIIDGALMVVLAWIATGLTDSALLIALVPAATRLPWLVLSLPLGAHLDGPRPGDVMRGAAVARAVTLAAAAVATVLGGLTIWLLIAVALLVGATEVGFDTTAETTVPSIVSPERLERVNGHARTAELVGNDFVGRPIGGFLVAAGVLTTLTSLSGASLILATLVAGLGKKRPVKDNSERAPLRAQIRTGWDALSAMPAVRLVTFAAGGLNLVMSTLVGTQVLFVQEVLGLSAVGFGFLLAATSIGSVLGSQSAAGLTQRFGARRAAVIALTTTGLTYVAIGSWPTIPVVSIGYVVVAANVTLFAVSAMSLRQRFTPSDLLGRVVSISRLWSFSASMVGMGLGGAVVTVLATRFDRAAVLSAQYVLAAIAFLIVAAVLSVKLRSDPRLDPAAN